MREWISILLLTASWFFLLPIYRSRPDFILGNIFLIAGSFLFIIPYLFRKEDHNKPSKQGLLFSWIVTVPLIVIFAMYGYPYGLPFLLISISLILYSLFYFSKKVERFGCFVNSLFSLSMIFAFQILAIEIYLYVFIKNHYMLSSFSSPLSYIFHMLGISSIAKDDVIYIATDWNTFPFTVTIEKVSLLFILIFVGASIPLLILKRPNWKKILVFLLIILIYPLVRFTVIMIWYTNVEDFDIFFNPLLIFISFLPLALLIEILFYKEVDRFSFIKMLDLDYKKSVTPMVAIFLSFFLLIGSFAFQDPGIPKKGRILIDEFHSDWEDTTRAMDKDWYGKMSTYNYYSMRKWLEYYYDVDINLNRTLIYDYLKDFDILILKCPTQKYSKEEIESIEMFVRNGGGLYLIGDHTNVFGMNLYLNQVSEQFGIKFKFDATYMYPSRGLSYCEISGIPHPVVQWMKGFSFLTSCTLETSILAENVIIGNALLSESGTYSTENFFKLSPPNPSDEVGIFVQSASIKYGRGRVVAFTDSTCFSNFAIFMDGYPNYNLGVIEYLNRENSYPYNYILFASSIALWLSLFILYRRKNIKFFVIFIIIAYISIPFSANLFTLVNRINYPLPEEKESYNKLVFLNLSDMVMIDTYHSVVETPPECVFNTFFVWTQRVNYIPYIANTLQESLKFKPKAIIIINPTRGLNQRESELLRNYISNGGNLILMDTVRNSNSKSNSILGGYNIGINIAYNINYINITNNRTAITEPRLIVYGSGIVPYNSSDVHIAYKDVGSGRIIVVVDSYSFSNAVMGGSFVEPTEAQRAIYETEYYILEKMLK